MGLYSLLFGAAAPEDATPTSPASEAAQRSVRGPNITDGEKILLIEGKVAEALKLHTENLMSTKRWRDEIGGKTATEAQRQAAISAFAAARVAKWAEVYKPAAGRKRAHAGATASASAGPSAPAATAASPAPEQAGTGAKKPRAAAAGAAGQAQQASGAAWPAGVQAAARTARDEALAALNAQQTAVQRLRAELAAQEKVLEARRGEAEVAQQAYDKVHEA